MQPQSCLIRSLVRRGWSLHVILMGMDTTTNTESRKLPPQNLELDQMYPGHHHSEISQSSPLIYPGEDIKGTGQGHLSTI